MQKFWAIFVLQTTVTCLIQMDSTNKGNFWESLKFHSEQNGSWLELHRGIKNTPREGWTWSYKPRDNFQIFILIASKPQQTLPWAKGLKLQLVEQWCQSLYQIWRKRAKALKSNNLEVPHGKDKWKMYADSRGHRKRTRNNMRSI